MIKASDSSNKFTAREHAAMTLKVPNSGTEWLDDLIRQARQMDAEQLAAKLVEAPGAKQSLPDPEQAAGRAKRTPASKG